MSNHERSGISAFSAAVVGAVTAAAALFLSKPENRKKVQEAMNQLLSTGEETIEKAKKTVKELKGKTKKLTNDMEKITES